MEPKLKMCFIAALWHQLKSECAHHAGILGIHKNQVNNLDIHHEEEKDDFLDMALVYHVLSPNGICGQAKPLWHALENNVAVEDSNPVIESLVTSIAQIIPHATTTSRIMSVSLAQRNNSMDMENWVSCQVQQDGKQCSCSICKPYYECFELYTKYKSGDMDAKTAKMINSLDLSPMQLEFLEALQLSV